MLAWVCACWRTNESLWAANLLSGGAVICERGINGEFRSREVVERHAGRLDT